MISQVDSEINQKKIKLSLNQILLALLSGVLTAVSASIVTLDWIMWFSIIPLFYSLYKYQISAKTGFQLSFIFSLTYYLGLLTWLFRLHPLTWVGFSNPVSLLLITTGWFTFSLIESIGLSFVGGVIGKLKPQGWKRILFPTCLWIIIEWLQSLGETGFTWGRLAISQYSHLPLIQSSGLFGSLFITGLIVFINAILAITLIDFMNSKNSSAKKPSFVPMVVGVILFVINISYGYYNISSKVDDGKEITASIAQGNILSDQKWDMKPKDIADIYLDLSYKDANNKNKPKTDLMVWPESAVIDPFFNNRTLNTPEIFENLKKYTASTNTLLLTGIFTVKFPTKEKVQLFNSIIGLNSAGTVLGTYSKRHLVPFGEYLPFRNIIEVIAPSLAHMNALGHDVSPGIDSGIITSSFGKIGSLVCYDSIFPQLIRSSVKDGAGLLVLSTNDSWYKDSMGVYQHNAQSVFRAVENDRYMVRAANTGVSSIIGPDGKILELLPPLVKGTISGKVKFRNTMTLYSQTGDLIAILALVYLAFVVFFRKKDSEIIENI